MSVLSGKPTSLTPGKSALRTFLFVVIAVIVYAYAIDTTRVNLETPTQPGRQAQLINVLHLLARPDIFTFDATGSISGLSLTSQITVERMVETILMALMASTVGTLLAVPVSFIAARNLMEHVTMPLAAMMAAILGLPIGGWAAGRFASFLFDYARLASAEVWMGLLALLLIVGLIYAVLTIGKPIITTTRPSPREANIARLRLGIAFILAFFALGIFANLGIIAGRWLQINLGALGFIGNFIFVVSDFIRLVTPTIMTLLGALIAASWGSHYGQEVVLALSRPTARLITAVLGALGTAVFVYGVGSALVWLYLPDNPQNWTTIPALIGGAIGAAVGLLIDPKRPFPIGFALYTLTRGILNALRSIESIILAIVFVIWVGIGPFAGFMALALHSIAALGKLFSEQVESISHGPVEAITATGANRIQTIAFAVIPQIIPPYIAFAFYRWDINVRMSTILGFVGAGGIGFVLQQNIALNRYEQASVMMLAIAVVVATLDYFSSSIRSKII